MATIGGTDVTLAGFIGGEFTSGGTTKSDPGHRPGHRGGRGRGSGAGPADVDAAVAAAARGLRRLGATTPGERSEELLALAAGSRATSTSSARSRWPTWASRCRSCRGVRPAVDNLRFFAGAARTPAGAGGRRVPGGLHLDAPARPARVVAVGIAPWNYPLMMAVWKIGPGAGRGQHLHPQAVRADAADRAELAELAADIFPPGVFNVVTGAGRDAG